MATPPHLPHFMGITPLSATKAGSHNSQMNRVSTPAKPVHTARLGSEQCHWISYPPVAENNRHTKP